MKLIDALKLLSSVESGARELTISLVSGTTPEPFSTLLAAHLQLRMPDRRILVTSGLYGDLAGNLERSLASHEMPTVILVEWADLDPRLGMRQAGGWGRKLSGDIAATVGAALQRLLSALRNARFGAGIVLSPPTLPMAPVIPAPVWHKDALESKCAELMGQFLTEVVELQGISVLSDAVLSSLDTRRLDLKSLWAAGSPYRVSFASELASQLATALFPVPRAKGLITDLDDTLWAGLLGEVGVANVAWDLDHRAMSHGIYQQFLQSLADDGVLVAVASKNDQSLVEECLSRPDMLLKKESIFPIEAHWQSKVQSVERILRTWNIGEDSVVFVDDNVREVEAVQTAFRGMDCRVFPAGDPEAFWFLLHDLSDRFGQVQATEEDKLRLASIRAGAQRSQVLAAADGLTAQEDVLRLGGGELTLTPITAPPEPRALELINKTNQFNLNGVRYLEKDWLELLKREGSVAHIISYRDKFGSLGKIAVLAGQRQRRKLVIEVWVLSCRAFSRRIEHTTMDVLFSQTDVDEIVLRFSATARNTPVREFLEEIKGEAPASGEVTITRAEFDARKPTLYLSVEAGA